MDLRTRLFRMPNVKQHWSLNSTVIEIRTYVTTPLQKTGWTPTKKGLHTTCHLLDCNAFEQWDETHITAAVSRTSYYLVSKGKPHIVQSWGIWRYAATEDLLKGLLTLHVFILVFTFGHCEEICKDQMGWQSSFMAMSDVFFYTSAIPSTKNNSPQLLFCKVNE